MRILLSIKPEYADKIFSGEKKYEYRKLIHARKGITTVVVYSTLPVGKIIGEFEIEDVLQAHPDDLWASTKESSGINKQFFSRYFEGRRKGFALKVANPVLYDEPICPMSFQEKFYPPQSFIYLPND